VIKLYDLELSGNCYTVRLLMGVLGVPYERIAVDPGRDRESPWFQKISPLGQVPAIEDNGFVLHGAQAILVYLASTYDTSNQWYPRANSRTLGRIAMWLAFADSNVEQAGDGADASWRMFDEHLWHAEQGGHQWICSSTQPTIADIACFPEVMRYGEGGISRLPYNAIRRWTDRVKRIPGFIPMPRISGKALLQG
jgi:glutathione S-transferase